MESWPKSISQWVQRLLWSCTHSLSPYSWWTYLAESEPSDWLIDLESQSCYWRKDCMEALEISCCLSNKTENQKQDCISGGMAAIRDTLKEGFRGGCHYRHYSYFWKKARWIGTENVNFWKLSQVSSCSFGCTFTRTDQHSLLHLAYRKWSGESVLFILCQKNLSEAIFIHSEETKVCWVILTLLPFITI